MPTETTGGRPLPRPKKCVTMSTACCSSRCKRVAREIRRSHELEKCTALASGLHLPFRRRCCRADVLLLHDLPFFLLSHSYCCMTCRCVVAGMKSSGLFRRLCVTAVRYGELLCGHNSSAWHVRWLRVLLHQFLRRCLVRSFLFWLELGMRGGWVMD